MLTTVGFGLQQEYFFSKLFVENSRFNNFLYQQMSLCYITAHQDLHKISINKNSNGFIKWGVHLYSEFAKSVRVVVHITGITTFLC